MSELNKKQEEKISKNLIKLISSYLDVYGSSLISIEIKKNDKNWIAIPKLKVNIKNE